MRRCDPKKIIPMGEGVAILSYRVPFKDSSSFRLVSSESDVSATGRVISQRNKFYIVLLRNVKRSTIRKYAGLIEKFSKFLGKDFLAFFAFEACLERI